MLLNGNQNKLRPATSSNSQQHFFLNHSEHLHSIFFPGQFHEQIAKLIDFLSSSLTFFQPARLRAFILLV